MLSRKEPDNIQGTCGTYEIEPHELIEPLMTDISPVIAFSKEDLPEPTWKWT
jgi:hypothetical protein